VSVFDVSVSTCGDSMIIGFVTELGLVLGFDKSQPNFQMGSDFRKFLLHTLGVRSHLKIQNKLCQLVYFKA